MKMGRRALMREGLSKAKEKLAYFRLDLLKIHMHVHPIAKVSIPVGIQDPPFLSLGHLDEDLRAEFLEP